MRWIVGAAIALVLGNSIACRAAEQTPGVTETEIKVGTLYPLSGPASALGLVGKGLFAYVSYLNDRGGVSGRKVNLVMLDDAYSPPKAVEQARRLVEGEEVTFIFGQLGTPGNSATAKYLTGRKVPSIAVISGASEFTDQQQYPYVTTGMVSYVSEGKVYARYLNKSRPGDKIAILYQNDDLGRDFVTAFKSILKEDFANRVVTASYDVTDPTVDSQVVSLQASGAAVLFVAGTPKFTAQALRKAHEMNWSPLRLIASPSASIASTLKPVGLDISTGILVGATSKDASDPRWKDDQGVRDYRTFFQRYLAGADFDDGTYQTGYQLGMILEQLLKQCDGDFSRENVIRQALNFKDVTLPTQLPGVKINTSATNNQFLEQMQMKRWTGSTWEPVGDIIDGGAAE